MLKLQHRIRKIEVRVRTAKKNQLQVMIGKVTRVIGEAEVVFIQDRSKSSLISAGWVELIHVLKIVVKRDEKVILSSFERSTIAGCVSDVSPWARNCPVRDELRCEPRSIRGHCTRNWTCCWNDSPTFNKIALPQCNFGLKNDPKTRCRGPFVWRSNWNLYRRRSRTRNSPYQAI